MALLTVPKTEATEASVGPRVRRRDGQALDIIERVDLARQMIADDLRAHLAEGRLPDAAAVRQLIDAHLPAGEEAGRSRRRTAGAGQVPRSDRPRKTGETPRARRSTTSQIGGKRYTGKQIDRLAAGVNPSLYLMRGDVFYQGVGMIRNDNAQGEYYITDMVRLLAGVRDAQGRAALSRSRRADRPSRVGAGLQFARRAAGDSGLRAAEAAQRREPSRPSAAPAAEADPIRHGRASGWPRSRPAGPALQRWLRNIYGPHEDLAPAEVPGPGRRAGVLRQAVRHGRKGLHRPRPGPGQPHGPARRPPRRNDQLPGDRPRDDRRGRAARRRRRRGRQHPARQVQARPVQHRRTDRAGSPGATG